MALADILDRAVALYRGRFLGLAVIPLLTSGAYLVASQAVQLAAGPVDPLSGSLEDTASGTFMAFQYAQLWLLVLGAFVNLWATAALFHAVSRRYMGLETSWQQSLRVGLDRVPYLAVTSLALWLAMTLAIFFLVLPFVFVAFMPTLVMGLVIVTVCLLPVAACFALVLQMWLHGATVVIESCGAREALARSRALMRRRVGPGAMGRNDMRLSVVVLVLPAIAMALGMLAMVPAVLVALLGGVADWLDVSDPVMLMTVFEGPLVTAQLVAGALYQPLAVAVTVVFYYDIRYRTEGLDLELRALELAHAGAVQAESA